MTVPAHRSLVRGRVALERGDPKQALEDFSEGNRPVAQQRGRALLRRDHAAEQLGDFEPSDRGVPRYAMRIDVRATDAYLRLARLQAAAGQPELALATLEFSPGDRPDEEDAALLELELAARNRPRSRRPRSSGASSISAGRLRPRHWRRDSRRVSGPSPRSSSWRAQRDIDLIDPKNADALAAWIEFSAARGAPRDGLARAEAATAKHPDSAALHALRGDALAAAGSSDAAVRAAYQRALEIEPEQHRALAGLAALEAKVGARESALALYERAARADANDRAAVRMAADLLVQLGRRDEGEARLGQLIARVSLRPASGDRARRAAPGARGRARRHRRARAPRREIRRRTGGTGAARERIKAEHGPTSAPRAEANS
jgi:tetratricopeptide (TPR) repeat protein